MSRGCCLRAGLANRSVQGKRRSKRSICNEEESMYKNALELLADGEVQFRCIADLKTKTGARPTNQDPNGLLSTHRAQG
eukprot:6466006-Amphidinium_carterae.1